MTNLEFSLTFSDGILCSFCNSLMWSFFEFSGFFCSIAVCLFTPLKENSVEWWGTKEASPSLSKQELTYTFRRCCLAIVAVFFGRSRAKPLNQSATFSLSPLFSGKRGKSRLLRHSPFSLSTFVFDTCDTLARDTSHGWKWLKRQCTAVLHLLSVKLLLNTNSKCAL